MPHDDSRSTARRPRRARRSRPQPDLVQQQPYDTAADLTGAVGLEGARHFSDVAYARIAGFRPLLLSLAVPVAATAAEPVPVVLYLHGGAFLWGAHNDPLFGIGSALLARGIAVASAQYRLLGEALYPAAQHDVSAAIRWLKTEGPSLGLDATRVGVMGESAGGHLAVFAGTNSTDAALNGSIGAQGTDATVSAAVGWYPVTDFSLYDDDPFPADAPPVEQWPAPIRPDGAPSAYDIARWASPVNHVTASAAPMLLVHGDADTTVPLEHSHVLASALSAVGVDAELVVVPGGEHVFPGMKTGWISARTAAFFAERLQSRDGEPSAAHG
ncbi:alpha/beta hydrolase [Rathayibacter sp. YIM 133350]|uniref:alpha/beta hydrolase n=1 Tax=Rathayibacter sp. YIM 133350 TaxID=3131992 RepID=UPI00307D7B9B